MNSTEVALLALAVFGLVFGVFAVWLVYPRDRQGESRARTDIWPAE